MAQHSGFELVGDIIPDEDKVRNLGSSTKFFDEAFIDVVHSQIAMLRSSGASNPDLILNHTADEWNKGQIVFEKDGSTCWKIILVGSGDNQHLRFDRWYPPGTWVEQCGGFDGPTGDFWLKHNLKVDSIKEYTSGAGVSIGSNFKTNQAHLRETVSKSSGSTIANTDPDIVKVDLNGSGDFTITLPAAADNKGREITIVTLNSGMNLVV